MKRIYIFFLLSVFLFFWGRPANIFAQTVSNVESAQQGNDIVVTYTIDREASVALYYSEDGGKTFKGPLSKVSGTIQPSGPGTYSLIWHVLFEVEGLSGDIIFKVSATSLHQKVYNYEYVDLGLSVKWATCNLGAASPYDNGNYYAWAEIDGNKREYSWLTYKYCKGSGTTLTKYCTLYSLGTPDGRTTLCPEDDPARTTMGGKWRVPTYSEWMELINSCTWSWRVVNGVKGYIVRSKKPGYTRNYIFLPAAGYQRGKTKEREGASSGYYWSNSLMTGIVYSAIDMRFTSSSMEMTEENRYLGLSIRPVCGK